MADIRLVMQAETAPIDRAVRVLDNLEAELRNVRRAEKQGLIDKKRLRQETERLTGSINRLKTVSSGSAKEFLRFEKSVYGSGKAMRQKEIAMQQAGYQLQDFIVQVQAGTNPLIAFSQQGSQLAGFFAGPWGAAIGLGIAALGSLGMAFMSTMGSAADFDDQMKEVESTLGRLAELLSEQRRGFDAIFEIEEEKIKRLSQASKDLLAIAKIEAFNSVRDLADSLQDVYTEAGLLDKLFLSGDLGVTGALLNIDTTLRGNITVWKEARKNVKSFMEAVRSIDEQSNIQDMYESAVSARDIFKSFVDVTGELTEEQRNFWKEISTTIIQLELLGATQKSTAALGYQAYGKSRAEGAMMDVPSVQQYADAMFAVQRAQMQIAQGRRQENKELEKQEDFVAKLRGEAEYTASLHGKTADQIEEINDRRKFENQLLKIGIKHGSYMYAQAVQYYQQARQNTEASEEFANKLKDAAKAQEKLSSFETNLDVEIAKITAEIEALKKGEDASVASFIAGEKLKAEALYETAKALYIQTGQIDLLAEAALQYMEVMENLTILENKRKELLILKGTGTGTGSKRESMASIIEGIEKQANLQRKLVGLSDQEADRLQILYDLKKQNKDASGKMTEVELNKAAERIAAINAETAALEKSLETTQGLAETIGNSFGDAFLSIIEGTESAKDAFRLMAQDILKDLYRILVVEQMVESLKQSFGGSGGTAGNFVGDLVSSLASNEGGGYTGSGPRSGGLDGKGGFLAMLHPKETVIDHHKGQSGGQPVQVVYNFQGGVTEADLGRALPVLVERTKREVVDAVQRGGNVARVFR